MKATMNENGMITIQPESAVDAYALRQWAANQKIGACDAPVSLDSIDAAKLLIDAEWPQDGSTKHESPRGILSYLGEKP